MMGKSEIRGGGRGGRVRLEGEEFEEWEGEDQSLWLCAPSPTLARADLGLRVEVRTSWGG